METVCIKMEENLLKDIDGSLKNHNFSTRTEFIRAAIRDKLEQFSREDIINEFMKFKGKAKTKVSDERLKEIRKEVSKELMEELDKRFK